MNKLTRNNLQEFCRTCLGCLQGPPPTTLAANADNSDATDMKQISILNLLPQLLEMLILLTSSDNGRISSRDIDDNEQIYPQSLCRSCYDKLIDFQEFRNLTISSAEILHKIVNDDVPMAENRYEHDDGDDNLVLPELVMGTTINAEPAGDGFIVTNYECAATPSNVLVKDEIDLGYEKERMVEEHDSLICSNTSISGDVDTGLGENGTVNIHSASSNIAEAIYNCPHCLKSIYKQSYLYAHIRTHHEGHDKGYLCVECQKDYRCYTSLHKHLQVNHTKQDSFICRINGCGMKFSLSDTLEKHWRVGHDIRNLQKIVNDDVPMGKNRYENDDGDDNLILPELAPLLGNTIRTEAASDVFILPDNECAATSSNVLVKDEIDLGNEKESKVEVRDPLSCSNTSISGDVDAGLGENGTVNFHSASPNNAQANFNCPHCYKSLNGSAKPHLHSHSLLNASSNHLQDIQQQTFSCTLCSKKYRSTRALLVHQKRHHPDAYEERQNVKKLKLICKFCSKNYCSQSNLLRHMERRHWESHQYQCDVCNRCYPSIEDLNAHKKSHTVGMTLLNKYQGLTHN